MATVNIPLAGVDTSLSAIATLACFGVVSIVLYLFVLKPLALSGQQEARHRPLANGGGAASGGPAASRRADAAAWPCATRMPPHATKLDALLIDGMVAFRSTTAATYETSQSNADVLAANRKDRARILSRILTCDSKMTPPPRGGSILVSIPAEDLDCAMLRRVLFLLATYFSLVVIISVTENTKDEEFTQLVKKLRGPDSTALPEAVLPSHRIVAAQSRTGRIALVRQLGRLEFVLDHEEEVKTELDRFGFKVFVYGGDSRQAGMSRLAAQLMY